MRMPKTSKQSEWWVKRQIREILDTAGWTVWTPIAGTFGASGVSDFLAIKKPKLFMAIEAKYENVVTAQQFKFLTSVHEAGHYAFLVDETNVDKLLDLLNNLDVDHSVEPFMKWQSQNQFGEKP
jgi:hypothetical protein